MHRIDSEGYGNYLYRNVEDVETGRPNCLACGDPVKIVHYNGRAKYAPHCHDCYSELKHGTIPKATTRRKVL